VRTLKLTLAYDGTAFAGWQMQAGQRTVQGVLEEALASFATDRIVAHAAGRTDAGVHAAGQVVSFALEHAISCDALLRALNVRLPPDVRVLQAEDAAPGFHARFHARRKTYHYCINNAAVALPQTRHFAWHVRQALDVHAMSAAAAIIIGEHDFAAFQATGGDVITSRREIFTSEFCGDPPHLTYQVTGNGFLRHMVRNLVGTLVDIGRGRYEVDHMRHVLQSRDRSRASATAPPHGLTLFSVDY
jgi:tRNA pseudouridine38-40 synthase